jgi:hypothetical protein
VTCCRRALTKGKDYERDSLLNEKGEKTAVQIDLKKYGELWEDFYDSVIAKQRINEPRESFEFVKEHVHDIKKPNGQ